MMTINRQIEDMTLRLPTWRMERLDERTAVWVGELCPYSTTYTVRIEHTVPLVLEYRTLVYIQPLIKVLSPLLQRKAANVEGPLPHVYWRHPRTARPGPFLCVFDAEAREWTLSDPISLTTVPFTLNWLQAYEGWLATGRWLGLGRHLGQERTGEPDCRRDPEPGTNTPGHTVDRDASLKAPAAALGK